MTNIAIDIGTTRVRVFYLSSDGSPMLIGHDREHSTFPAVVWSSGPGAERVVGHKAAARIGKHPEAAVDIKRLIATNRPILVGGLPVTAVEVLAELLMHARRLVEAATDNGVNKVVITTPAYFAADVKYAIYAAAVSVFFDGQEGDAKNRLFFDLDPLAASRAYGWASLPTQRAIVYDLGATFNVALLNYHGFSGSAVPLINGDLEGGGASIDARVASWIFERLVQSGYDLSPGKLEREDSIRRTILKNLGERVKLELTVASECILAQQFIFTDDLGDPVDVDVTITRGEFEDLIDDIIGATIEKTLELLRINGLRGEDIDRVFLVGGASRMPIVAKKLASVFSCPISLDRDSDLVIGRGAALNSALRDSTRPVTNVEHERTVLSGPPESSQSATSARSLRVFLCHTSADKNSVWALYKQLRDDGFDPWLDVENLLPGQEWEPEIIRAVKSSDVVLVCLSPASITKHGFVQKEIKTALDVADEKPPGTIFIIPAKLEQCAVPERLQRWQWVSLTEKNGYDRLIKTLRIRKEAM